MSVLRWFCRKGAVSLHEVPGAGITHVDVYDPDGNRIEVQFAGGKAPRLD